MRVRIYRLISFANVASATCNLWWLRGKTCQSLYQIFRFCQANYVTLTMHIKHAVPTWRIYIFMVVSKPLLTVSAAAIQTIQDVMQPVTASLSKYLWEQNFAVQIFMCWYLIAKKKM